MATFDECFNNQPSIKDKPKDFNTYWKNQLDTLKAIPLESKITKKTSKKLLTESHIQIEFNSAGRYRMQARLLAPKKFRKKTPVVVIFNDYHDELTVFPALSNAGIAQFVIRLRGNEELKILKEQAMAKQLTADINQQEPIKDKTLGLFSENLLQKQKSYINMLYLDAFRTLEVVRLRREIDTKRIGVWGRGVGAAMALFVTAQMKRTSALFLEHPSMMNLEVTQNLSKAKYCSEINQYLKSNKKESAAIKKNLKYFDAMYLAPEIEPATAVAVNLKNNKSIAQGAFAMFHHLKGEKDMHLFTADDEASLKTEKKNIINTAADFFKKTL